jgi:hypothetical protein
MALMSQQYIEQNDVVLRYLHGKLTAKELVEFEKYMLLHPDILQDIELTQVFKRGLELSQSSVFSSLKTKSTSLWILLWPAIGVATGALATWLLLGPLLMPAVIINEVNSPELVYIDAVRGPIDDTGTNSEALINQQAAGQILILDVSQFAQTEFTLTLQSPSGETIKHWPNIIPN